MELAASNVESFFPGIHGKAVALRASTVAPVCPAHSPPHYVLFQPTHSGLGDLLGPMRC